MGISNEIKFPIHLPFDESDSDFYESCIASDVSLLFLLSENMTDEDFEIELSFHLISHGVFQSLTAFMKECPMLFKDQVFLKRLQKLLLENRKLYLHQKSLYELDDEDRAILRSGSFQIKNESYYARMKHLF